MKWYKNRAGSSVYWRWQDSVAGWATYTLELAWEPGLEGVQGLAMEIAGRWVSRGLSWPVWGTAVMLQDGTQPRTEQQDVRIEIILPWTKDLKCIMPGLYLICPWTGFLKLNAQPLLVNGYSFIYYWLENKLVPFLWDIFKDIQKPWNTWIPLTC